MRLHLVGRWVVVAAFLITTGGLRAEIPRPEHPRPDLYRANWMTLNGEWQFEHDKAADGEQRGLTYGMDLKSKITVPFCPESNLSGLAIPTTVHMKDVWYRRTFTLPAAMKGQRVRLHFGGVDYRSWVYVNGQLAGSHVGESVDFKFEITKFLKDGPNEVVIKVLDDLWSGQQPGGKQSENDQSAGCFYTRTTGIWQTVWMEPVSKFSMKRPRITPDVANHCFHLEVPLSANRSGMTMNATVSYAGKELVRASVTAAYDMSPRVVLTIPKEHIHLWNVGDAHLYDITLTLSDDTGNVHDTITTTRASALLRQMAVKSSLTESLSSSVSCSIRAIT